MSLLALVMIAASAPVGTQADEAFEAYRVAGTKYVKLEAALFEKLDKAAAAANDPKSRSEIIIRKEALRIVSGYAGRGDTFGKWGVRYPKKDVTPDAFPEAAKAAQARGLSLATLAFIQEITGTSGLESALSLCDKLKDSDNPAHVEAEMGRYRSEMHLTIRKHFYRKVEVQVPADLDGLEAAFLKGYRDLYEAAVVLVDGIVRLRPPAGFKLSEKDQAAFKERIEKFYTDRPEYREKKTEMEEARNVATITGLPEADLSRYQSYNGTYGLREITLGIEGIPHREWVKVYFLLNGMG